MRVSLRHGPPATRLFVDYLENWSHVQPFYAQPYSLDSIRQFAVQRPALDATHRNRLCSVLAEQQSQWGAGQRGVEKLQSGAVAVITGQQPVLFTGPLFSILKAITAIKLAARLEQSGVKAVPVFWVAAEDHDFAEIEPTWILNRNSELFRVSVDLSGEEPRPAGWLEFRDDVRGAITSCLENLPQSEFIPDLRSLLESSYQPGVSPVDAFAKMMARLFEDTELTFVNPLHDGLRSIAQPVIDKAIAKNSEIRTALMARNKALSAAGYHAQVKVDENFTGLFAYRGRARQVVRPGELDNGIAWSPNVLLRPIFQDTLFPTATYIGGPAEVAYFAQVAAVYETLGMAMPPICPRISATLVEPRVAKLAEKYGIEMSDVLQGREHLKRKAVAATQDDDGFDRVRSRIEEELESLKPLLNSVDATLAGALDTSRQKVLHQLEGLKGKYINAVARRNETLDRHLDTICNSLFPEKKQQERVINIALFIARYGRAVLPALMERLSLEVREHQVVEI
jgi:bacillithiol synthase